MSQDDVVTAGARHVPRVRSRLLSQPWAWLVVPLALAFPLGTAGVVAITGRPGGLLFIIVGVLSCTVGAWAAYRGSWELNPEERAAVSDATCSGHATGNPRLDAIAAYQLEAATRSEIANRVAIAVLIAMAVLAPILAEVRSGDMWWLLALFAAALLTILMLPALLVEPARDRLRRLTEIGS